MGVFSGARPTFVYGLAVCIYHELCTCVTMMTLEGLLSILCARLAYNQIGAVELKIHWLFWLPIFAVSYKMIRYYNTSVWVLPLVENGAKVTGQFSH